MKQELTNVMHERVTMWTSDSKFPYKWMESLFQVAGHGKTGVVVAVLKRPDVNKYYIKGRYRDKIAAPSLL